MSATRTQIYLTEVQRERIGALSRERGLTMAEVVRRAVDAYLDSESPNAEAALAATFGVQPTLEVPDRSEWDRG